MSSAGDISSPPNRRQPPADARRVHSRLYQLAQDLRHKQEARRRAAAHDVEASRVQQRSSMSWISQEMMRERTSGQFDNYGEMLYAEGLEVAAQRKARVRRHARRSSTWPSPPCRSSGLLDATARGVTHVVRAMWRAGRGPAR